MESQSKFNINSSILINFLYRSMIFFSSLDILSSLLHSLVRRGFCIKPFVHMVFHPAPHQPRLDWQMWFAALGSYEHNPWLVNLVHQLLRGQKEGKDLFFYFFSFHFFTLCLSLSSIGFDGSSSFQKSTTIY